MAGHAGRRVLSVHKAAIVTQLLLTGAAVLSLRSLQGLKIGRIRLELNYLVHGRHSLALLLRLELA